MFFFFFLNMFVKLSGFKLRCFVFLKFRNWSQSLEIRSLK